LKKPDFIVLGAPKSGTTSLHNYLKQHPKIFVPQRKEINYFSSDLKSKRSPTRKEYYSNFERCTNELRIGDVAVFYLFSESAVKNIIRELGQIDLICILRNPIEAVQAYHSHMVWTGNEDLDSFEDALKAQKSRTSLLQLPKNLYQNPKTLQYLEIFNYGKQIERILDYISPEKLKIILFDDFKNDVKFIMDDLYRLLNCETIDTNYPIYNQAKKVRFSIFQNLIVSKNPIKNMVSKIIGNPNRKRYLVNMLKEWNSKKIKRSPLNESMKNYLIEYYRDDLKKLEKIIGRDMSCWYKKNDEITKKN